MPPIINLKDRTELIPTKEYKLAKWNFDHFNPVQSRLLEYYNQDVNGVVATKTGSGKTCCAEVVMAHVTRIERKKALYLCPYKSIAQEKVSEWTSPGHHFSDLKTSICTGDYRLTPERLQELQAADIIIMTFEMLSHRCRNFSSENSLFLQDVGLVIQDEFHTISADGRGDHLEVGLMKFTQIAPDARLLLLSGTMPNAEEIGEWISYILNKKKTFVLKSDFRPVPLRVHYEPYTSAGSYHANEDRKVEYALEIIQEYPEDKFLVFAHGKDTGLKMVQSLQAAGIDAGFHNANLDRAERLRLEDRFRNNKNFRVLVATSTLSAGVNTPARRVIILGVHRGLKEVQSDEINQSLGRAGRPGYDNYGDGYVLVPEKDYDYHVSRLNNQPPVTSRLLDCEGRRFKNLAFHLVSEIHHGGVKTKEDAHNWFARSFAHFQKKLLDDSVLDSTLDSLKKSWAISEEDGIYKATSIGTISSMYYFSPFDVADLKRNFDRLFDSRQEGDDYCLAMALADIDTNRVGICNRAEKDDIESFRIRVRQIYGNIFTDGSLKIGCCYFHALNGSGSPVLNSTIRTLKNDLSRLLQVATALDSMASKWHRRQFITALEMRAEYGVRQELVPLVRVPQIGPVRAQRLYEAGFHTPEDVASNPDAVGKLLKMKGNKLDELLGQARLASFSS